MKSPVATSISSYIDHLGELSDELGVGPDDAIWYRGQPRRCTWDLRPGLYRREFYPHLQEGEPFPVTPAAALEALLKKRFVLRSRPLLGRKVEKETLELLFLMQQHGVPTRLLDWTENPLAALFFAVRDEGKRGEPPQEKSADHRQPKQTRRSGAAVYLLKPTALNSLSHIESILSDDEDEPSFGRYVCLEFMMHLEAKYPTAYLPPLLHQRMVVQQSVFTLHGNDPSSLQDLNAIAEANGKKPFLAEIRIPRESLSNIYKELTGHAGVTEYSLFPDLDGLGRELCSLARHCVWAERDKEDTEANDTK